MSINLNIALIDTYDPNLIGFSDISNYDNKPVKNPSFEISAPGFNKVNVFFTPKSVNLYSSIDIGMGCDQVELPDGLYTIKYAANNEFVEKTFFKVDQLTRKYGEVFLSLSDCNCPPQKLPNINEVMLLINGSISSANQCDFVSSEKKYRKAEELIERMHKCNC